MIRATVIDKGITATRKLLVDICRRCNESWLPELFENIETMEDDHGDVDRTPVEFLSLISRYRDAVEALDAAIMEVQAILDETEGEYHTSD